MSAQDHLAYWPACRLRQHLLDRSLSPVDVAEACLKQVSRHNPTLNAIVTVNERLLDDAKALEQKPVSGLLYGLPVGIKDTTETRGLRTTFGSIALKDNTPARDALVVRRLKAQGALILGKTNTPTFAAGAVTWNAVFGHTRNPWDVARTPGGSTGGGAAALAAGMVALADGSDLGGSLRIPAAFCGLVGLRPSPGLVPLYPSLNVWDTLSVAGGMGRTAEDVALFLQAVAAPAPDCAVNPPAGGQDYLNSVAIGPSRDLRLGWCINPAGIGIESTVLDTCLQAIGELSSEGWTINEIDLDLSHAREAFAVLRGHHLLVIHYNRRKDTRALGEHLHGNLQEAQQTTSRQIADASRVRHQMWEQFKTLFRRIDFLFTPTTAVAPFPVEDAYPSNVCGRPMETYYDWLAPTSVFSLLGWPVVSVPCGLSADHMPVGLQIIGRPCSEGELLALAQRIQQLRPVGQPPCA